MSKSQKSESNNKLEVPPEIILDAIKDFVSGIDDCFLWSLKKDEKNNEEVFYTDNITNITGYSANEIKHFPGRGTAIVFEEDLQKVKKIFSDFVNDASKNFIKLNYRIVKKDKTVIWIKESVSVRRDGEGKAYKFFGIVTEISDMKEEGISLKKSLENFKQLNASKDKFISILSHDLRAPFTSILGFSEILINEPNLSKDERLEYLNYINASSQNQLQLINYLLDWSRLQTGRIKIEPQRLNIQSIIYNCISSLTGNAIRKNIEIKVHVKETLYIQADERLLTQVITNLISNAIKFSPEGKTIDIFANIFNENFIEIIVKDEGIGISDSNKTKLFKIERMFSTEGTKGERGTGLGLSLVKEIIERHGGEIWYYSELSKGSEFHFTIPSLPNTILLLESDSRKRENLKTNIEENFPAFRVVEAKNGYEALSAVLLHFPSLIIIDDDIPLMSGIQFVQSIRKEDKRNKIPIIAIVPEINEKIKNEFNNLGINILIQKSIDQDLFNDKIQSVLDFAFSTA